MQDQPTPEREFRSGLDMLERARRVSSPAATPSRSVSTTTRAATTPIYA